MVTPYIPSPRHRGVLPLLYVVLCAVLGLAAVPALAAPGGGAGPEIVRTDHGLVRGVVGEASRAFLGIPFAAPPVGDLRWRPPQPAAPWWGTRDATEPGSECVQGVFANSPAGEGAEDCLYLNVTTPLARGRAPSKRPVIVWIHGGGFAVGSGSQYDPSRMASQGGAVVVTVNYRLAMFGFLAHPYLNTGEGTSGNFGLQDQQAALRWVQRNIAAFGGDPGNVTIAGESAGAMSVCDQLVSPGARGLFHKAIEQSGSCSSPLLPQARAEQIGVAVASGLGCSGEGAAACLRGKTAAELAPVVPAGGQGWFPVAGGTTVPRQPADAITSDSWNRVPVMLGGTRDEMNLFAALADLQSGSPLTPEGYTQAVRARYGENADEVLARYPVTGHPTPTLALGAVQTDCVPGLPLTWCANLDSAELFSTAGRTRVRLFEFADRTAPPLVPGVNGLGAYHGAEIAYLFDVTVGAAPALNADQRALSNTMIAYWTTFAATGDPNSAGRPAWPAYATPADTLSLAPGANGIRPVDAAAEHQYAFWQGLG